MGFTFGFTEDIENDVDMNQENDDIEKNNSFVNPIDNVSINQRPKLYTLEELCKLSFLNTRITYEPIEIENDTTLFRRELFDVRHQLMMEDSSSINEGKEEFNILIGETGEDLKNGVYEGGLKSWECSYDMISKLKEKKIVDKWQLDGKNQLNVIELGCGTSLPTLYILKTLFTANNNKKTEIRVVLSDYNFDVLRLVTLPNILLNWCFSVLTNEELIQLQQRDDVDGEGNIRDGEIDITDRLVCYFINWMKENKIEINFISGSWCREFMDIVKGIVPCIGQQECNSIVMTSETIYSPDILPVISEMMVEFAQLQKGRGVALLSAKDIYFGVGGSIVECIRYLKSRGVSVEVVSISGSLKRSVVCIE